MKRTIAMLAVAALCSCASGPRPSALAELGGLGTPGLCAGALESAIAEVRSIDSEERIQDLTGAIRWASSHHEVECNPVVSARRLWQESLSVLASLSTRTADLGLVESLRESHRPGSVFDRRNAALRLETDTALRSLGEHAPLEGDVVSALLDWYGGGAMDCSAETFRSRVVDLVIASGEEGVTSLARRFPPASDAGRCDPAWLLTDVIEEVSDELRERLIAEVLRSGEGRLGESVGAMSATEGPLREALGVRFCSAAISAAEAALGSSEGQPARLVEDAAVVCAATSEGAAELRRVQRGLTEWHVARGEADEAWAVLEGLPQEDVDEEWRAEVGVTAIFARLDAGNVVGAVEMLETLSATMGSDNTFLQPVRGVVQETLATSVGEALESGNLDAARELIETANRIFAGTRPTRRLEILVRLAETDRLAAEEECRDRQERRRLHAPVELVREQVRDEFEEDEELMSRMDQTWRRWRGMLRRCSE